MLNELARMTEWDFDVTTSRANQDAVDDALDRSLKNVKTTPFEDNRKVLRVNPHIVDHIRQSRADFYFTPDYLVLQDCPIPHASTLHDAIRLKFPHRTHSDEDVERLHGADELVRLRQRAHDLEASGMKLRTFGASSQFLQWFDVETRHSISGCQFILCPSSSAFDDVRVFWPEVADKALIAPAAVDRRVFASRPISEIRSVVHDLQIAMPYVLLVGGALRGHKRMDVVADWLRIGKRLESNMNLVIVAHGEFERSTLEPLRPYVEDGSVRVVGPVSDDELACLYSGAVATLVASETEGFCLPAREALACNCRVVAPRMPALEDLAEDDRVVWLDLMGRPREVESVWKDLLANRVFGSPSVSQGGGWSPSANLLKRAIERVLCFDESVAANQR